MRSAFSVSAQLSHVGIAQCKKHSDSLTIAVSHAPHSFQPNSSYTGIASSATTSRKSRAVPAGTWICSCA